MGIKTPEQVAAEAMHLMAMAVPINGDMYLVIRKMVADAIRADRAQRELAPVSSQAGIASFGSAR